MAAPIVPIITALAPVVTKLLDKKKPTKAEKVTTAATAGGVTCFGVAYALIETGDMTMQILGSVVALAGIGLAAYQQKD